MFKARRQSELGTVTAEAAMGIGLLTLITVGLAWVVCLGVVAVRAQDAAREAVRALARGDDQATADGLARRIATAGSSVIASTDGRLIQVHVRSPVRGPGGIFGFIGPVVVSGEATGVAEGSPQ